MWVIAWMQVTTWNVGDRLDGGYHLEWVITWTCVIAWDVRAQRGGCQVKQLDGARKAAFTVNVKSVCV